MSRARLRLVRPFVRRLLHQFIQGLNAVSNQKAGVLIWLRIKLAHLRAALLCNGNEQKGFYPALFFYGIYVCNRGSKRSSFLLHGPAGKLRRILLGGALIRFAKRIAVDQPPRGQLISSRCFPEKFHRGRFGQGDA